MTDIENSALVKVEYFCDFAHTKRPSRSRHEVQDVETFVNSMDPFEVMPQLRGAIADPLSLRGVIGGTGFQPVY